AVSGKWLAVSALLPASACLYCGGMVWNDYFDLEQDRKERPFRPIPSGRVSRAESARIGAGLLALGLLFGFLAGWGGDGWRAAPFVLTCLLVVAVLHYDAWLKRTWAGPLAMGACRFLNVLLGVSAGANPTQPWALHLALVVGLYIVGVTWFARTEARASNQAALGGAAAVMLAGLVLALPLPVLSQAETSSVVFPYLLVAFGFVVGFPVAQAVAAPTPARVQAAVKRAVLGLVALDAVLATALAGLPG